MFAIGLTLSRVETALSWLASACMVATMVIVGADVAMRYFFNAPMVGVSELVGLYLMVALFYFAMTGAFTADAHIRVDLLLPLMSRWFRRLCEFFCCALAAPVFVLIAIPSGQSAWTAYEQGFVLAGLIPWPTWIPSAFIALGCWLMALRLAFNAVAHAISLFGGNEFVALPDLSGHGEGA